MQRIRFKQGLGRLQERSSMKWISCVISTTHERVSKDSGRYLQTGHIGVLTATLALDVSTHDVTHLNVGCADGAEYMLGNVQARCMLLPRFIQFVIRNEIYVRN